VRSARAAAKLVSNEQLTDRNAASSGLKQVVEPRRLELGAVQVVNAALLTCPRCGVESREDMPTGACQFFYTCHSCHVWLRPRPGDCCVFCSYADEVCPAKQVG
jgi:hypothetical protein